MPPCTASSLYSEPSYSVIFTGAWPNLSDGPAFNEDYENIPTGLQDNLFAAVGRIGQDLQLYQVITGLKTCTAISGQAIVLHTRRGLQSADREVVDQAPAMA